MTNKLAVYLGLVIVVAILVDLIAFDATYSVFLAKKFIELIDYIAFWR